MVKWQNLMISDVLLLVKNWFLVYLQRLVVRLNAAPCCYLICPAVPLSGIYLLSPQGVISHHSACTGDRRAEEAHILGHTLLMARLIAGSKLKWGNNLTCWPDGD